MTGVDPSETKRYTFPWFVLDARLKERMLGARKEIRVLDRLDFYNIQVG